MAACTSSTQSSQYLKYFFHEQLFKNTNKLSHLVINMDCKFVIGYLRFFKLEILSLSQKKNYVRLHQLMLFLFQILKTKVLTIIYNKLIISITIFRINI